MVGRGNRHRNDRGASLVEFALIMPLLVLLLFGMVDAGWAFSQHLEVRHGAREAARLAAVSAVPFDTGSAIVTEACQRMTSTSPDVIVSLTLLPAVGPGNMGDKGQAAAVTVTRSHSSLVGFIPFFDNITLTSDVEIRLEQDATWADFSDDCGP